MFQKIKSIFSKANNKSSTIVQTQNISMSEREREVYDIEQLTLQKLYEKWLCKDKWLLYEEGIPLLFGLNPDANRSGNGESDKTEELWGHAKDCVQKKLLSVINPGQSENEWEVIPADLYRWAMVSRISVPAEFSALMAFVMQTVKLEDDNNYEQVEGLQDSNYQKHREIVLGAATSLLVNAPEQCKNNNNLVVNNITRLILENKKQWFGEEEPLLKETEMISLINDYIELTKPVM